MPTKKKSHEEQRQEARRYVETQEKSQKALKDKIEREQREIKDHQVEGIHRHLYDSMSSDERREAFGRSHH